MQTQFKIDEVYDGDALLVHHDSHIKAYHAQNMGIKVVFCDLSGVPISNSLAPVSSYLPNTSYNM